MDTSGLCTLKSIVDDVMNDYGATESEYLRFLRFAERGLTKIKLNSLGDISTAKIEIDSNTLTAPLPRDYALFSRLGVIRNGKMYTLVRNDNLQINRDTDCGVVVTQDNSETYPINTYATRGGLPELGEYRINEKMFRIEFGSNLAYKSLILEYVSTGLNNNGETYIPEVARETLIAWVNWQYVTNTARYQNRIAYAEKRYYDEYEQMRQLLVPSLDEMLDAYRQTKKQTV